MTPQFKFKFSELSDNAKNTAIKNYLAESPDQDLSYDDGRELCEDCENDILYNELGQVEGE